MITVGPAIGQCNINNTQKEKIMGYYVNTAEVDFFIAKYNFEDAYKACVALNDRDDLKSGGGGRFVLPNGEEMKWGDPRPEGMSYHPMKWFSWMDANYPETCKTLDEILTSLGFEISYDEIGNIDGLSYSSKIGAEEHFLEAISPFVRNTSYINWVGEDNAMWRHEFIEGKMIVKQPKIIWE